MATTLPVPVEFSLPQGWRSVHPDELGAPGAAFVALHPASRDGFTATIALSGELRDDEVPLTRIADEAARRLHRGAVALKVGRRGHVGGPDHPGLTQVLRLRARISGGLTDLVQLQVFLAVGDDVRTRRRAVLHVALTATPRQFARLLPGFQEFVATIRPEGGTV
ncbi:hypothetical protein [Prauserella cavernicola]|uniref:DUF1795 domain-containing protein n=1 Tax=Prauserella cavernicola TaxID=2800127 RepID=A0A934QPS9_9PSEU|nr:hypothetical protein [Prauserella cavernicola]MBK1783278.1 hypothetical protein [Prauserella cavernicola]